MMPKNCVSGDELMATPWENVISSLTSELFVEWIFKITILLELNIIILSLDHFSAEEMASFTLSNGFFLIGWSNIVLSAYVTQ